MCVCACVCVSITTKGKICVFGSFFLCSRLWRCCCCCCCFWVLLVQSTIKTPSQHRSTIQACPKKGKQARADRAGIEPGTFRRTTRQNPHGPRSRQKSKKHQVCASLRVLTAEVANSLCASLRYRNAFQHQAKARICSKYHAKRSRPEVANSLCASLRSQNALRHQARARICGKYHAKRSRPEVANSLCASLRSQNALRHQARARICGKYHAKRSRPERAPQSGTKAFSLTVRTP